MSMTDRGVEQAVRERYSEAAKERVEALCCPTRYDPALLEPIPDEILERDYGCGDPSRFVRRGETVLDLGSGTGKICYIASQVVGPEGRVIGVDMNDEMLALAETHRVAVGDAIGHHNVEFHKARIQDLALDIRALEARLAAEPVGDLAGLEALERWIDERRADAPLVADGTIDVIVSNCVLNLVRPADKDRLFVEMARVLRDGGRAVISDIVAGATVPDHLRADPELWSGCISGAYREDAFLEAFERAGFRGVRVVARDERPWRVVEGIEFRSVTVEAFIGEAATGSESCCAP